MKEEDFEIESGRSHTPLEDGRPSIYTRAKMAETFLGGKDKILGLALLSNAHKKMVLENKEIFSWEDVQACLSNKTKPLLDEMFCPLCGKKAKWIRFRSPDWTWRQLCGREGPMALCLDCHLQLYFDCDVMS